MVTLIQRFGSALNLNIHFHMLFLDEVYVDGPNVAPRSHRVKAPNSQELTRPSRRVGRLLERQWVLEADAEKGN